MKTSNQTPKHFRSGLKKIKKTSPTSEKVSPPQELEKNIMQPQTLDEINKIEIVTHCFDEYTQDGQLEYLSKVLGTVRAVDASLLKSLHTDITPHYEHRIDKSSSFGSTRINISINVKSKCQPDSHKSILEYLHWGRHIILTHDFNQKNHFDELLRKVTELVIDVNNKIHMNRIFDFNCYFNRISLAKAIEKLSTINKPLNGDYIFGIRSPFVSTYQVKSIDKCKAINLLGGKYMSKKEDVNEFIVKTINFTNIESKLVFLRDGCPVNVFITDEHWVDLFNDEKIKLTKNERIKTKYLVERSPLTNKIVAYYFTDIYIDHSKL